MLTSPWLDVLDDTIAACAAHQRPDLGDRLRQKRATLLDPKLRVFVVGEPNQGKSQLINALLNAPVCAVGDHLATAAPVVIEHAESPTAALVRSPAEAREPIAVEGVSSQTGTRRPAIGSAGIARTEVGLPRKLLATGLVLVDTPAVDDLDSMRTANTFAALTQADAVMVVSAATRELSASELYLLDRVARVCPTILLVLTKIDIAPRWRRVAERDRSHLAAAGIDATVLPVSATLRAAAASSGDHRLNAESGFTELINFLRREVLDRPDLLATRAVAAMAGFAIEQLLAPLQRNEQLSAGEQDGKAGQRSTAAGRWQAAQDEAEELRRRTARWQTGLADDMADLISDIEFDLRDRTRRILREVDSFFDEADPLMDWDDFADWLTASLADAADANFTWLVERFHWVACRQAEHLERYREDVLPKKLLHVDDAVLDREQELGSPRVKRFGLGQKMYVGLRGSYGGLLMFGLATSIAGWPLFNAVSIGAGAAFAAKSVHDESGVRLKQRQAAAKATAQRHIDDFFLAFSKESKDIARALQRRLRDHFTELSREIQAEIFDSARIARQAAADDAANRHTRARDARVEVDRLAALRGRLTELAPARSGPALGRAPRGLTA